MNIWIVSDTHFHHENIKKYYNRPSDIEDQFFNFWLKNIKFDDVLLHLGDVSWRKEGETTDLIKVMPGKKILVRGNHDYHSPIHYMEKAFDFACDNFTLYHRFPNQSKKEGQNILFSHKPIPTKPIGVDYNVHGHLHTTQKSHREGEVRLKPWHILFPIDEIGWMPIKLDEFLLPRIRV